LIEAATEQCPGMIAEIMCFRLLTKCREWWGRRRPQTDVT